ncbi:MAG TPA: YjgN family protein [Burkholderiaceae bacterium]|nr:YjgN family protein [Burkholderiaceae bacterium]
MNTSSVPVVPHTAAPSQPASAPPAVVVDSGGVTGMVSSITADPAANSVFSRLLPPRQAHHLPVEFTGSGSEYFRIWIVNLLLTLVTLGLYYPWAKVRKLRYFYGNTWLGGHSLDFHGEPKKMLRGTVLAGALFFVYARASEFSAVAALVAAVALAALWPLLLRGALQFRLGHTSWRGLRLAFAGSTADAYKALMIPLLLFLLPTALVAANGEEREAALLDGAGLLRAMGAVWLLFAVGLPYFHWRLKKYQHDHLRLGQLQTELRLGPRPVYGVYLRTLLLLLALPAVFGLVAWWWASGRQGALSQQWIIALLVFGWALFVFGGLYLYMVVVPYFTVAMQNLVWTKTGNRYLRFRSELRLGRYLGLQLKNWLLVLVTLGLYWPWAAVATRRLRLESVTLVSRVDLDDLVAALQQRRGDAAADMADDLLGLDIGL